MNHDNRHHNNTPLCITQPRGAWQHVWKSVTSGQWAKRAHPCKRHAPASSSAVACIPMDVVAKCSLDAVWQGRECSLTLSRRQRVADACQTLSFALLCTPTVLAAHALTPPPDRLRAQMASVEKGAMHVDTLCAM
jgi:hypothetical protein